MKADERYERGSQVMKELFSAGTRLQMEQMKTISPDLWEMIVSFGFGDLYARSTLSLKTREIITLTSLITQGAFDQLRVHLRAALNAGLSQEEIKEVIIHCIGYTGFPKAVQAMGIAAEVFAEMSDDVI